LAWLLLGNRPLAVRQRLDRAFPSTYFSVLLPEEYIRKSAKAQERQKLVKRNLELIKANPGKSRSFLA